MQRIGKRKTRCGIDRFLADDVTLIQRKIRPGRVGQFSVVIINATNVHQAIVIVNRISVVIVVALATIAAAKHHFMLTTKQVITTAHERIH
ncbi:hypothetical protein D3C80_1078390 [compost metagenome]